MEVMSEQTYVRHHIQKVMVFFAAMRQFANTLQQQGHAVHYIRINDVHNRQSFTENILNLVQLYGVQAFEYQLPDEHRLDAELKALCRSLAIETKVVDTEHFYTTRTEMAQWFSGKKQWLMESFYRHMRRKHNILMEAAGQPLGGKWNYDAENRSGPPKTSLTPPPPPAFTNDYAEVLADLAPHQHLYFGTTAIPPFALTFEQALATLQSFIETKLAFFGKYQDAMVRQNGWLYHSILSVALNLKLIRPHEVVNKVVQAYTEHPDRYPLASVEGFVRQIIGWREYMRGLYWAAGPEYKNLNALHAKRPLPAYYWTGQTNMQCVRSCVGQSLQSAYAHHIQRLMVTGNLAALLGVDPAHVNVWYLGVYADAIEWVQLPNTHGMSQWADGGIVATKPYISSGAYINKMSDYCKGCYYDVKQKTGARACPFNALYWHYLVRHQSTFNHNPRMTQMYAVWKRFSEPVKAGILDHAAALLSNPERL